MTKYCLLHRKTAVSLRQNGHFRASDNWFLMCKWQENNAQNIYCVCLKSASNLNGNLNCSKELEHYAS